MHRTTHLIRGHQPTFHCCFAGIFLSGSALLTRTVVHLQRSPVARSRLRSSVGSVGRSRDLTSWTRQAIQIEGAFKMAIRIVLADDHQMTRESLSLVLSQQPDFSIVAQTGDGRSAVRLAEEHHPDIAVIDVT